MEIILGEINLLSTYNGNIFVFSLPSSDHNLHGYFQIDFWTNISHPISHSYGKLSLFFLVTLKKT